ncbi:MAG: hypothetical protein LBV07_02700 [Syntrophobacterales bacterium]|jgi:hypothetical protein|nr:hypothetical protein [Syntrophobacterales bacterium]
MLNVNKRQGRFLLYVIDQWEKEGVIHRGTGGTLRNSFSVRSFDWKRSAKYSFIVAIICGVIAVGSAISDPFFLAFLRDLFIRFFVSSDAMLCVFFSSLAALFYYFGIRRRKRQPQKIFSNEAIIFIGALLTSAAIIFLGKAIDTGSGHFSLLILLATIVYALLGLFFPSKLLWIFAVLSLGAWFGTETGYMSGWGAYYLGMNYPLRFVLFGGVLVGLSFFLAAQERFSLFQRPTYVLGLLYFFVALWILSIFGNYGDASHWWNVKQIELFHWGIIFALAAIGAIYYGLKQDDPVSRGFGVTFLFINLYTKYFEFFWNATHKAVFFAILGVSFALLGLKAEKIWNLEFLRQDKDGADEPKEEEPEEPEEEELYEPPEEAYEQWDPHKPMGDLWTNTAKPKEEPDESEDGTIKSK